MNLDLARTVADAVLYEGYLLYPYRASSAKNRSRWQFGVLGPPGAEAAGMGEASTMRSECLLAPVEPVETRGLDKLDQRTPAVVVRLRFLQLQAREVERYDGAVYVPVEEMTVDGSSVMSWDEAVEQELVLPPYSPGFDGLNQRHDEVDVPGGEDVEPLTDASGAELGRVVRRRWPLTARVDISASTHDGYTKLTLRLENEGPVPQDKDHAIRTSLIGAHLLLEAHGLSFVSLLEPPDDAVAAVAECRQDRCWPVLTGEPGDTDLVLCSPIILYDYPEVAEESAGALFDSTEIDEILTLRVMTMTDEEKREARATDPRAREIIDRCDAMTPEAMRQLHGALRDPHQPSVEPVETTVDLRNIESPSFDTGDVPWWDPAADEAVRPEQDAVTIDGVSVAKGSLVRVHPSRRADAQDLFFADQVARVTAVLSDVDGNVHVALVLVDDPAADMHDWYGRYLYFSPDELEPLSPDGADPTREESRP